MLSQLERKVEHFLEEHPILSGILALPFLWLLAIIALQLDVLLGL
jgi:hypothetical protein